MTDNEGYTMERPTKPNYRRRQLGRTLRKLREAAGLSQEDAGRPLRFSTSKMSRIEQGYIPGYNDFLALLDRYGAVRSHDGLHGNFLIASFPDPSEPDLAYVSYGFGALQVEKDAEVRAARLMFDNLARLPLDQKESHTFIAEIQDGPRGDRGLA
ncbi:Scr1 family TA system antitoxin-like transcriptional regulator [Amycolatopsis sp. NPDC051102]|uniref:Scr1 family TA system antitoxin-like transcriptional regulator n=1 Tax=Amycolatopsis sp. NPDC051102 TaxID=3155163 RepID=UPI0034481316